MKEEFIPVEYPKQMRMYDDLKSYYERYFDKVCISDHFKKYITEKRGYCPDFLKVEVCGEDTPESLKCKPSLKHHVYSMEKYYGDGGNDPDSVFKAPDWANEDIKEYLKEYYPDLHKIFIQ